MHSFELTDEDWIGVELAKDTARFFLTLEQVTPEQIIGLGNALHALERLPEATPGAHCEFGIAYRAGTQEFWESRYVEFSIMDSSFEISAGGHTYDRAIGGDGYSEPGLRIEVGGFRTTDNPDLITLADSIREYVNLGAELVVRDESQFDPDDDASALG